MKIKTIIADDHHLLRSGFKNILSEEARIELLGEAQNGLELLQLLETQQPHVLLLDLVMPHMSGIEAGRIIREKYPAVKILVLSMSDDDHFIREMWHLGAKGYLLKDIHPNDLLAAIQTVWQGGSYYSPEVSKKIDRLLGNGQHTADQKITELLFSDTEKKVLIGICKGLTGKEIGSVVHLAGRTVEHYIERMRERTSTKNAAELATYAVLRGIVKREDLG